MYELRIIPEEDTFENLLTYFRKNVKNLNLNNCNTMGVFLVTMKKFDIIWNVIFEKQEHFDYVKTLKKEWVELVEQKRIVVVEDENIKNIVDIIPKV